MAAPVLWLFSLAGCDEMAPAHPGLVGQTAPGLLASLTVPTPGLWRAVTAAARQELSSFVAQIPRGREREYGFSSRAELRRLSPGPIYRMVSLERLGQEMRSSARDMGDLAGDQWRVAVLAAGRYRALCTVSRVRGGWHLVDLGAATLARELQALERTTPASRTPAVRVLVRAHALGADFLLRAPGQGPARLIPLESARRSLGVGPDSLSWAELQALAQKAEPHVPR